MTERMSVAQYKKEIGKRGNKFHAKRTFYNGRWYDSEAEANYSAGLDQARNAKKDSERIVNVEYQVPFKIYLNGTYICTYRLDFREYYADKTIRNTDVKGLKEGSAYDLFKMKKKLVEAQYGIVIQEM